LSGVNLFPGAREYRDYYKPGELFQAASGFRADRAWPYPVAHRFGTRCGMRRTLQADYPGSAFTAAVDDGALPDSQRAAPLHANIAARSEPAARTEPTCAGRRRSPLERTANHR